MKSGRAPSPRVLQHYSRFTISPLTKRGLADFLMIILDGWPPFYTFVSMALNSVTEDVNLFLLTWNQFVMHSTSIDDMLTVRNYSEGHLR